MGAELIEDGKGLDKHAQSKPASLSFLVVAHSVGTQSVQHGHLKIKPSLTGEEAQSIWRFPRIQASWDYFSTEEIQ